MEAAVSDLSQDARSLIASTQHDDDPHPVDEARVHRALMLKIGAGAVAGGVAAAAGQQALSAAAKASTWSALLGHVGFKIAAIAVIGGAVTAGGVIAMVREPASQPRPLSASHVPAPTVASAPVEPPKVDEDRPVPVDELPIAATSASAPEPDKSVAPSAALHRNPNLGAEVAAVEEANRALRAGDPERAMRVLDGNAKLLEGGTLKEESDVARILALCDMGKQEAAAAEARRFLQVAPHSPLVGRVKASCAFVPSSVASHEGAGR
jgi:hypothetical protein